MRFRTPWLGAVALAASALVQAKAEKMFGHCAQQRQGPAIEETLRVRQGHLHGYNLEAKLPPQSTKWNARRGRDGIHAEHS